jgi:hypothetical protein
MKISQIPSISITCLAISLAFLDCKKDPGPCSEMVSTTTSPSGKFEAQLTIKTCAWGFGLAAETVTLKMTKLGEGGWYYDQPIEFDSINRDNGCPPPTLRWTGPDQLSIFIVSSDTSGRLARQHDGLTVIREYSLKSNGSN